ncbi:zinc knuckle-domain-containing protein [Ilyonectria robusta]|uniref:zinc knuckle-domain-containing protein n=1 Tax=Ilyonectria robusta TaxID=1079257 RepID=UPI001E8E62D7|nr:zinc knuckle-domain-containing protein [Ilyonectria robusta]KAH8699730.1 zinc knuckle-domain-containing protein [Ilyonectria robusta]
MFGQRGRGGPSRSTPANVQCQKCLKRGHYSYECKASAQERPYVSRPSRSQQLRNPKLVPKLTNDSPNPLEKKEGVADEQLAKAEAERARKREREEREDELMESSSKRQRSVSSHSVSTISTGVSRSPSPPRRKAKSPPPQQRGRSPHSEAKGGSRDGRRDYSSSRSRSRSPRPQERRRRSVSRDSRSPDIDDRERSYRARDAALRYSERDDAPPRRSRRESMGSRDSFDSRRQRARESTSPEPKARQPRRPEQHNPRRGRDGGPRGRNDGNAPASRGPPPEERARERSLSPFSRRLALTQSLNTGGR